MPDPVTHARMQDIGAHAQQIGLRRRRLFDELNDAVIGDAHAIVLPDTHLVARLVHAAHGDCRGQIAFQKVGMIGIEIKFVAQNGDERFREHVEGRQQAARQPNLRIGAFKIFDIHAQGLP